VHNGPRIVISKQEIQVILIRDIYQTAKRRSHMSRTISIGEYGMTAMELDRVVDRLLPQVLADPELGDGQVFTHLHFSHLWALSCLHIGEYYDEHVLATSISTHLPPKVYLAREVAG
jgi:hypothetical protein